MERVVMDIVTCGENYIEVNAWLKRGSYSFRQSVTRHKTGEKTCESQQQYNDRQSVALCRQLIKTNFSSGKDWFITLTFRWEKCPDTYEELLYVMKKYLKVIQQYSNKHEIVFRWLFVVEQTARGRYHVHMLVNRDVPRDVLEDRWDTYGRLYVEKIGYSTKDLDKLAAYIQKAPVGKHGYHYSKKTLQMPVKERDEKLMEPSIFKSLAYESHFAKVDVAEAIERLFPGYRMVMDADDRECCGWIDEWAMTPYMYIELERIRDDAERERQYERLAKQTQCLTPSRRMNRDAEYWSRMAKERMELRREEQKEKLIERLLGHKTKTLDSCSMTGLFT